MGLTWLQGDLTKQAVDAIVNAANTSLLGGGGVDGAIHRAGGPKILEECQTIRARQGGCPTGQAVITGAGNLPCRFVIHTVGPVWRGGHNGESEQLVSCYRESLLLARQHSLRTIAFPCISTGIYGFPAELAAPIAVATARLFEQEFEEIRFVVFLASDAQLYAPLLKSP